MGTRINVYICDEVERGAIKVALAVCRAKSNGLSAEQAHKVVSAVYNEQSSAEPCEPAEPKSEDALPSNSEREIPATLRPFISQGWDLDTAFRIYDEWHADMSKITDKTSYVKSLYERFIEERKKQYADESAE